MKMETIKKVLMNEISDDNLATLVSECNGWDGSYGHLERFDMEYDLDMFVNGNGAHWLANRIFYGDFDPNDSYFNFDDYGNLQSFNENEYNEMLVDEKEEIIETALELHEQNEIDIQLIIDKYVQE